MYAEGWVKTLKSILFFFKNTSIDKFFFVNNYYGNGYYANFGKKTMVSLVILIITVVISLMAFKNSNLMYRFIFNPYRIKREGEWYRFWSAGFIHADYSHLGFNMLAFYSFGRYVEQVFNVAMGTKGLVVYVLLYLLGMGFSHIFSYFKYQDNPHYNALGASGAVSAVIFSSIILSPRSEIYFYFIPIKAYIFGPLYLAMSAYLSRQGSDNIGHDAHFSGAIFGLLFTLIVVPNSWELFRMQIGF